MLTTPTFAIYKKYKKKYLRSDIFIMLYHVYISGNSQLFLILLFLKYKRDNPVSDDTYIIQNSNDGWVTLNDL